MIIEVLVHISPYVVGQWRFFVVRALCLQIVEDGT